MGTKYDVDERRDVNIKKTKIYSKQLTGEG